MPQETSLDTLSAMEAESLSLSIRPVSGGLAFAIHPRAGAESSPLSHGFLQAQEAQPSWAEAIQDLFFQHQGLTLPFYDLKLYCEPTFVSLIPKEFFSPGEERLWLGGQVGTKPQGEELASLSHQLREERKVLLFDYSEGLYQFLRRTYPRMRALPYFAQDLELVCRHSRQTSRAIMTCAIRASRADVYVVRGGEVIAVNTFGFVSQDQAHKTAEEVVYYVFSLWRALQLSGEADSLRLLYTHEEAEGVRAFYEHTQETVLDLLRRRIEEVSLEYFDAVLPQ